MSEVMQRQCAEVLAQPEFGICLAAVSHFLVEVSACVCYVIPVCYDPCVRDVCVDICEGVWSACLILSIPTAVEIMMPACSHSIIE